MARMDSNICKFVSGVSEASLFTSNFVLETKADDKEPRVRAINRMCLAVEGTAQLKMCGQTLNLEPGVLFFTFAGVPYQIINHGGFQFLFISFSGIRALELLAKFGVNEKKAVFRGFSGLIPHWRSALYRADDCLVGLISESVLLHTFSCMVQEDKSGEAMLAARVIELIESRFTDKNLSLTVCAEELGYSAKYISRIFRQNKGVTFTAYLCNIRIRHAVFLIEQGVHIVKNVALLSGFGDPLYFSSVFRQTVGLSPSEYIAGMPRKDKKDTQESK